MVRRLALVSMVLFLFAGVSTASAAPLQLTLPQGDAFSILGYSCGGIQEQVYASGFDAATGYPDGYASLSTRCGGSGRGGGYRTTTYTAWAAVSWDFTGAVVSYARTTSVAVNPTLDVFDVHGNELSNTSGQALLTLAAGFVPSARVVSVSPSSGPAAGGTTVTIAGTGFTGATGVRFGTVAAKSLTVTSSTSITAVAPAAPAGTVDVTVTNAGGVSATVAADQFTFVAAPVVSAVSPKSGPVAGGTTVTITGAHFTGATAVQFGSAHDYWFSIDSDTQITATAPAQEATGTVNVTVTGAGGKSATSTGDRFTYTAARPVVAGVDPPSGPTGGGSVVTISGSGFSAATRVTFGGVRASFSVLDDGTIEASSPGGGAGSVDVVVTGPGGTSALSAADRFTYSDVAPPTIDAVDPGIGPSAGGVLIAIGGSGFTDAVEVDVGGVSTPFVVNDDTSIFALLPAAAAAGTADVTVVGPGGSATAAGAFTYVDPPVVSGVDPNTGPLEGGTEVTITGSGFSTASEVDFGGVSASFTVVDDGTIVAVAPAGTAAGVVDVSVVTAGGVSAVTDGDQFTYS